LAHVNYDAQEIDAVTHTLRDGRTTCGEQVKQFEQEFARYIGAQYATMVNSGSSADLLVAFGLPKPEPGDEIIIPAVTWPTQIWSAMMAGYTVRLVDINVDTLQLDLASVKAAITSKTKAVFLTHLMGNCLDLDALKLLMPDITLIEDCCEALGTYWKKQHVGTFGTASAFSFFFSHLLNTMEGGMVITKTSEEEHQYRLLRSHGWEPKQDCRFWFPSWGFNVRPMEIQGAFGSIQLAKLPGFQLARTLNARALTALLDERYARTMTILPGCTPSWHGFPIIVKSDEPGYRDRLCEHLETFGIETRPVVAGNVSKQPAMQTVRPEQIVYDDLPSADYIHDYGFYIGVSAFIDTSGVRYVGDILQKFSW